MRARGTYGTLTGTPTQRGGRNGSLFRSGPVCCRAGPRGHYGPHPARLALASLRAVCGMARSRGHSLARPWAPCAPARASVVLRLPLTRHRSLARARSLPCLSGAARPVARGAAAPRRPRCARSLRLLGGSVPGSVGSRCGFGLALLVRLAWGGLAWSAASLPPCRLRPARRFPPAALFSLAPPAQGRPAAGAHKCALLRLRRRPRLRAQGVSLRRERLRR